jgi:hypothetical protein
MRGSTITTSRLKSPARSARQVLHRQRHEENQHVGRHQDRPHVGQYSAEAALSITPDQGADRLGKAPDEAQKEHDEQETAENHHH